jgi:hypothetical protein
MSAESSSVPRDHRFGFDVRLIASDGFLWVWLSRLWREWRSALLIAKDEPGESPLGSATHPWGTVEAGI